MISVIIAFILGCSAGPSEAPVFTGDVNGQSYDFEVLEASYLADGATTIIWIHGYHRTPDITDSYVYAELFLREVDGQIEGYSLFGGAGGGCVFFSQLTSVKSSGVDVLDYDLEGAAIFCPTGQQVGMNSFSLTNVIPARDPELMRRFMDPLVTKHLPELRDWFR